MVSKFAQFCMTQTTIARYYYAAPQDAGLPSSRGSRRGEFLPACKASEVTEGAEFRSAGAAA